MNTITPPNAVLEIGSYFSELHIRLLPAVPMTQEQFFHFCQQNSEIRFERTAQGELIIMAPSGGETGARNLAVAAQLYFWAQKDGTGTAYDSSAGFVLPKGANRAPDASWILKSRLSNLTSEEKEKFIPLCPNFVVEVMSPTDSLTATKKKMEEYVDNGANLGWLIYPKKKQVFIYRPGKVVEVLDNPLTLPADPELPGFVLDLEPVWRS
jgi:Uma2 family endonuclease